MNTYFFKSCAILQFKRFVKKAPSLLGMCLAVLFLSGTAAFAANSLFSKQGAISLTLAVASEEEDAQIDLAIRLLSNFEDIKAFANILQTTPEDAQNLVRNGKATAAILLPKGFLKSVLNGENKSPTLLVNAARPLETALITNFAQSAVQLLTNAQRGIYYTQSAFFASNNSSLTFNKLTDDINIKYASWLLERKSFFEKTYINQTDNLTLAQHYLLCFIVFFILLSVPVFFSLFSFASQKKWLNRLKSAACPLPVYSLSQIMAGFASFTVMLAFLLSCLQFIKSLQASINFSTILGLLLTALFLSCTSFLLCNVGSILACSILNFFLATACLLYAGGLIPFSFLPASFAKNTFFTPFTLVRNSLAPIFGAPTSSASLISLAILCFLLLCACFLYAQNAERRTFQ